MFPDEHQDQIGEFLRAHRVRLSPEDCGLIPGGRRRTPGLRREEVASLARVSTEWYTRLEQGRNARASEDALRRIARALKLSPAEHAHLLRLSGYSTEPAEDRTPVEREHVSPEIQRFLDLQMPRPAYVLGVRWDIHAWNRAGDLFWGNIASLQGLERNSMYQLFLGDRYPRILVDWERHARNCVSMMRVHGARWLDDPWFRELTDVLEERSPEFARLWRSHEIDAFQEGRKEYDFPEAGRLSFDFLSLQLAGTETNGLRMVVFLPVAGSGTEEKLEMMLNGQEKYDAV